MNHTTQKIANLRELAALVREDWTVNDRDWKRPGCQAMILYRFGVWKDGFRFRILRIPLSLIYWLGHIFIRNVYGIELYFTTKIGRRLRIAHQSGIVIHHSSTIGDDCLIRQGVSIGRGPNHGGGSADAGPILGNRVEIGANAILIGGITIGDDVVIGPNAVVMTNVPANSVVASPVCKILPRPPRPVPAPEAAAAL